MVEEHPSPSAAAEATERRPATSRFAAGNAHAREDRPARGRYGSGSGGRYPSRRKVCPFCVDNVQHVDYKDIASLRRHLAERGKIEPRRKHGTCARHQRALTTAIKRARHVALLPFVTSGQRG